MKGSHCSQPASHSSKSHQDTSRLKRIHPRSNQQAKATCTPAPSAGVWKCSTTRAAQLHNVRILWFGFHAPSSAHMAPKPAAMRAGCRWVGISAWDGSLLRPRPCGA